VPRLAFTRALTASQRGFNPLSNWQYEYVPAAYVRGAAVRIMLDTTGAAGSVQAAISSGGMTLQEPNPVQVGGTAGVIPSELNNQPLTFIAQPGDRLKVSIDELAAATPTVNGLVEIEPI